MAKTLLHAGSGAQDKRHTTAGFNTPEWNEIRLDSSTGVKPDVIGTLTDMSKIASESVDAVFSGHNLKYLFAHQVPIALKEFSRVLKPDGFVVITTPDLQSVCAQIVADKTLDAIYSPPAGPVAAIDLLYGHRALIARGLEQMVHHTGFTAKTLKEVLLAAGFPSVETRPFPGVFNLVAIASKRALNDVEMLSLKASHFPKA